MRVRAFVLILFAGTVVHARTAIDAAWGSRNVAIDGNADEWQGSMTFLEGPQLFLGARNDASDLYLCVFSRDPEVGLRAMARGLVLELRLKGSDPLRIQFPIGALEAARPPQGGGSDTFLLLGPSSADRRRVPLNNSVGIELRVNADASSFTYEAKIPLTASPTHPYAVAAAPGGELTLGLEPPQLDREAALREAGRPNVPRAGGAAGPRGDGDRGGEDRARPGGMGGSAAEGLPHDNLRPMMPQPLEVKVKVRLAQPSAGTP